MFKKNIAFITVMIVIFTLCSCNQETVTSSESPVSNTSSVESKLESTSSKKEEFVPSDNSSKTEITNASEVSSKQSTVTVSKTSSINSKKTSSVSSSDSKINSVSSATSSVFEPKQVKSKGIDVSKWQGKIDWKKVKNSGIDFAIIRIGYRAESGTIYKDEFADYNIQQADKAGILIGVYFFSTAINSTEALEEANWTYNAIKSYPISYPVVFDCEGYRSTDSRMYNLTNTERTQNAVTFLNRIKSLGYDGMLYASKEELLNFWDTSVLEPNHKIWVARYSNPAYPTVTTPDYSGQYDMWQYTDKGTVNGIGSPTDMIVSYFDVKKTLPKSNEKVPTAKEPVLKDDTYTEQNDTVTAKDEVNLRDAASTKSNIVGVLKNGETIKRTGVGINGWSKLTYNGKTVYAITSYLTTDLNFKPEPEPDSIYKTVDETVTAKNSTNLRDSATTDGSTVVYTLKNGETVKRIGIGSNGWSKLIYNGKTVYAVSSFLTTDLSYKEPVVSETASAVENSEIKFTEVSEQVTAKSETNLRDKPTTNGSTVIYTLKNGEYVTRTGTSDNGWSRLTYNGQTVYAVSSFLTK